MKIGIKTGPRTWQQSQRYIIDQQIKYVELWYRYDRPEDYEPVFQFLKTHNVAVGLHYWGVVNGDILPSFCHDQLSQYRAGIASVKQAIDVAAKVGATYVNIHPGSRVLTKINTDFNQLTIVSNVITPYEQAIELLLAAAQDLHAYATARNVLFLVETVPAQDASHWANAEGRLEIIETHHASLTMLEQLADAGIFIANDFGHTAASLVGLEDEELWQAFYQTTKRLAPQTKLLHVNTNRLPFNGTDSHDGILAADWANNVFPNEAQFKHTLGLFANRDDVWAIPEPKEDQILANYIAMLQYAKE